MSKVLKMPEPLTKDILFFQELTKDILYQIPSPYFAQIDTPSSMVSSVNKTGTASSKCYQKVSNMDDNELMIQDIAYPVNGDSAVYNMAVD